jgi:hypothetical protein
MACSAAARPVTVQATAFPVLLTIDITCLPLLICAGNCLRSCTSGSAQWRLRPPAADLWRDHQASWTEVHLMNVLLGSVLLNRFVLRCC